MIMPKYSRFVLWLSLGVFACVSSPRGQAQSQPTSRPPAENGQPTPSGTSGSPAEPIPNQQPSGRLSGTVVDQSGAVVAAARITLLEEAPLAAQETLTDADGRFAFAAVPSGPFHLTIALAGFATQTSSGTLRPGEDYAVPQIALSVAATISELRVTPAPVEMAEDQIKVEEKQRVFGVIPNFYVSYVPNAVPLTSKQKFELAWKWTGDPVNFGIVGVIAGVQQAQNDFSGYGQGAEGYAKRYAAVFANSVTGTFIGSAILPSLLKQDPRYFYKGSGSTHSRILYALANAVICKGDNGRWQANYSSILGSLASGGISNLYYPAKNRDGLELTFENTLINIGATAASNLLQEFVVRKFTSKAPGHESKVQSAIEELLIAPLRGGEMGAPQSMVLR